MKGTMGVVAALTFAGADISLGGKFSIEGEPTEAADDARAAIAFCAVEGDYRINAESEFVSAISANYLCHGYSPFVSNSAPRVDETFIPSTFRKEEPCQGY
jgi:hypothetical protein